MSLTCSTQFLLPNPPGKYPSPGHQTSRTCPLSTQVHSYGSNRDEVHSADRFFGKGAVSFSIKFVKKNIYISKLIANVYPKLGSS